MINLNIGKAVVAKIKEAKIGVTRFGPCIAEADTKFPYAVYFRDSVDADQSKDIRTGIMKAVVQINLYSDKYDNSLKLAQDIADLFDGFRGKLSGCAIHNIKVSDSGEAWSNDAYCQSITLEIRYN